MPRQIAPEKFFAAIASAAPPEGEQWRPEPIAAAIVRVLEAEAADARREAEEYERGRLGFEVQWTQSDAHHGDAARIDAMRETALKAHSAAVEATMKRNQALVAGIAGSVASIGSAYITGGMTAPAAATSMMGIATQIATALNGE